MEHHGLFLVSASNTDRRFSDDPCLSHMIGFELLRGHPDRYPLTLPKSAVVTKRTNFFWGTLTPGTYWLIPDAWDPQTTGGFVVQAASPSPFSLRHRPKTDFLRTLQATGIAREPYGRPDQTAGCPRIVVSVGRRCWLRATMQCDRSDTRVNDRRSRLAVQVHVCKDTHIATADTTLVSSPYIRHHNSSVELMVPKGRYCLWAKPVLPRPASSGECRGMRVTVHVECSDLGATLES